MNEIDLFPDDLRKRLLFFRWFKCILGCGRLVSENQNGLTIQVYMGIIASLLISVWTGRKPTKATLESFWFYIAGVADEDEVLAHVEPLKKARRDVIAGAIYVLATAGRSCAQILVVLLVLSRR